MDAYKLSDTVLKLLEKQQTFEPEMILSSLNFWFTDHEKVRSPFPQHMVEKLPDLAVLKYIEWADQLTEKARKEINDEILAEKFEETLFSQAHKFAETEDEKLTIKYPFLVRKGDKVIKDNEESFVVARKVRKDGDHIFMDVTLENNERTKKWETSFELPEY